MVRKLRKLANKGLIYRYRELLYWLGGRPKPGTISFSPSLSFVYGYEDAAKKDRINGS